MNKHYAHATAATKQPITSQFALFSDDVVSLAHEGVAAFKRWHRYRKTVRELSRLDNGELRNIGIHPSEIEITAYALAERYASARPRYL